MTLLTLRASVRTRLGVPSDDALFTDAVLTSLINDALNYVTTEADWWWLEKQESLSLTSGVSAYAVAADCTRTINVEDPTGVPLQRKPIDELVAMTTAPIGYVRFFSPFGAKLEFRPVPSATIAVNHRYIGGETALAADTDLPLIPAQFQPMLVEYAVYLAKMRAGNMAEAAANLEVYQGWIKTAKARDLKLAESNGGGQP